MRKPVIGVMPLVDSEKDSYWMLPGYFEGIIQAGGMPIMLPLTNEESDVDSLLDMCDGIMLTGGQDITPQIYGEEKLPECGECSDARDIMDTMFLLAALQKNKPVLGICRGIQLLNAVLGGTLYQDIPSQHQSALEHHQKPPYDKPSHSVVLLPGSPLSLLFKQDKLEVNSYHHQGIKELAEGLLPMAVAPDGMIEAVMLPGMKFVWGVQWHPEFIYKVDKCSQMLLKAFVDACQDVKKEKSE